MNRWIIALLIFPLIVAILLVKAPCNIHIIERGAPLVLLVVVDHGGCCKIFGILKTGFLVNYFGRSFADFLVGFVTYPFPFNMQYLCIWPLLPHLLQVIFDLTDGPPPEPLPFPMWRLFMSTVFKSLLTYWSIATVYTFNSESWYWDFSFLVGGSRCFELTRLQYSRVDPCTRDS